ncbi:jg5055 [Pararge aegeria aegeria]|uniref:Jg5055 protein n=1 Tax=Pararge aegeria aegeria TaxID=348720 RepID=A0A8S4R7L8_9NEOP|nr:jg5055 [Pararge aegeria aegeria]
MYEVHATATNLTKRPINLIFGHRPILDVGDQKNNDDMSVQGDRRKRNGHSPLISEKIWHRHRKTCH